MKRILVLLLLITSTLLSRAQSSIPEKNDTLSYLIGVNFGSFIKGNNFPVDRIDYNVVWSGVADFFVAEGAPYDDDFTLQFKYDPNSMGEVFNRVIAEGHEAKGVKNDTLSYLMGVNFGSFIKGNGLPAYKIDYSAVLEGISGFLSASGAPSDEGFGLQFKYDPNTLNEVFSRFIAETRDIQFQLNSELEVSFMKTNSLKYGVITTETGLQYKIIRQGNELCVSPKDTVLVNYKGVFLDGTVFDENESAKFVVDKLIQGWVEGISKVGEGGKIILYIPSHLAYGENGNRSIEPNSTLIFHVEVLSHWKWEGCKK